MGQVDSTEGEDWEPVATPPEIGQRRLLYLNRLGIRSPLPNAGFIVSHPTATVEAPDRLQSRSRSRSSEDDDLNMTSLKPESRDDFRVSYLRRLSYENVWTPLTQRPRQHQTVTIFDWDDTLLCTSDLNFRMSDEVWSETAEAPGNLKRELRGIQTEGLRLLEIALQVGQTFIITNALPSWVEYSAAKYVPKLGKVLQAIPVISARGEYETQYPGERGRWKEQAFLQVQRQLDSQIITNLISLGDSDFEMDAVHVMGREFAQALVKTVKFRANPSAKELHKELELVASKFEQIVNKASNLKICLERTTPTTRKSTKQPVQPRNGDVGVLSAT